MAAAATALLCAFMVVLTLRTVVPNARKLFGGRFGRRHRAAGAAHLCLLLAGCALTMRPPPRVAVVVFDILLGLSGTLLTATAASDFRHAHARVKNPASGTLDERAVVTVSEMVEHGFYQLLNLAQILYLHALPATPTPFRRFALACFVAAPWAARGRFPVNSFSDNYAPGHGSPSPTIRHLYRIKKAQYLLYKHCLLHGLNLSVLRRAPALDAVATSPTFRVYWIGLNIAYVQEFFLQTLVRRKYMRQGELVVLQVLLMAATTMAALRILADAVDVFFAILSLTANFLRRHHDVSNTVALAFLAT
ncbi:hypothetical protein CTAYLR_005255 [Chrysophaeum taylorii]|uniref:Uncharacterized protein n=1 Tax=Chrysophaeum taylorii TaxID=2483200 RepID=A0AAD7UL02_9STRA|nr:hypothetical protein CTAYLR_005255 [Chrysophaeum taylorii]